MSNPLGNHRNLATVLAALRYWQREGVGSAGHEQNIATDDGAWSAMSVEEIDELCEAINLDEPIAPAVVLEINGGVVNCVRASAPMRVVVLDEDTEGGDAEFVLEVNGEEVYCQDRVLTTFEGEGQDGVDPDFVAEVLEQLDGAQ
jgi:hypothetical protein